MTAAQSEAKNKDCPFCGTEDALISQPYCDECGYLRASTLKKLESSTTAPSVDEETTEDSIVKKSSTAPAVAGMTSVLLLGIALFLGYNQLYGNPSEQNSGQEEQGKGLAYAQCGMNSNDQEDSASQSIKPKDSNKLNGNRIRPKEVASLENASSINNLNRNLRYAAQAKIKPRFHKDPLRINEIECFIYGFTTDETGEVSELVMGSIVDDQPVYVGLFPSEKIKEEHLRGISLDFFLKTTEEPFAKCKVDANWLEPQAICVIEHQGHDKKGIYILNRFIGFREFL